jgi:hypothetical protein
MELSVVVWLNLKGSGASVRRPKAFELIQRLKRILCRAIPLLMHTASAPSYKSREALRSRVHADVRVHMEAVLGLEAAALGMATEQRFKKALRDVRAGRDAFIAFRGRLNEHIAGHGCV